MGYLIWGWCQVFCFTFSKAFLALPPPSPSLFQNCEAHLLCESLRPYSLSGWFCLWWPAKTALTTWAVGSIPCSAHTKCLSGCSTWASKKNGFLKTHLPRRASCPSQRSKAWGYRASLWSQGDAWPGYFAFACANWPSQCAAVLHLQTRYLLLVASLLAQIPLWTRWISYQQACPLRKLSVLGCTFCVWVGMWI